MTWSEQTIARALAQQFFNRKYLVVVPNCNWTGYECDILAITENLRIIDVEIKISRGDLKADAKKDKWVHRTFLGYGEEEHTYFPNGRLKSVRRKSLYDEKRLEWPRRVWKHYYALPEEIWEDNLLDTLGSPSSGVLLLSGDSSQLRIRCRRPPKPCKDADRLNPAAAINIARLASLRMWNAYQKLDAKSINHVSKTSGAPAGNIDVQPEFGPTETM